MMKKKTGIKASRTNVSSVPQDTSGIPVKPTKPVKPKKKWRTILKVIVIIILVMTLINIAVCSYFSPDNKVKRYLHAKYGSNRELSVDGGCLAELDGGQQQVIEWWRVIYLALPLPDLGWRPWEWPSNEYCSWRASFRDDSGHKFKVWLDDNHGNRSLQDNYNEVKSGKESSED